MQAVLVFAGGGLGSLLRYCVGIGADRLWPGRDLQHFPVGTFLVNVLGCFAIGIVMTAVSKDVLKEEHRLFLAVGILGGFTTFSSFAWETVARMQAGHAGLALAYVAASNLLGIAAAFGGFKLMSSMLQG